jgi:hypothetical protein
MYPRIFTLIIVLSVSLLLLTPEASADMLKLKDGTYVEGVIKKVEAGQVFVDVNGEARTFDILAVENMDFNTPHLLPATAGAPIGHFLRDVEAQEIVANLQDIEKTSAEIRKLLSQIQMYWVGKEPISSEETDGWETAKHEFARPLSRYQELLNDLYFHVLAKVDDYNALINEARKAYVGVKGIRIGSALVARDEKLPLRKYVPGAWYDTIFYEGYNVGYDEAYQKFNAGQK